MALLPLKIIPNDILYKTSDEVTEKEFGEELDKYMSRMGETMYAHGGVGLAGVQVGRLKRILVADLGLIRKTVTNEEGKQISGYGKEMIKIVNPEIVEESDEYVKASEGCLSYPSFEEFVDRSKWIILRYKTPLGEEITERFDGWEARIILHEMDHLDGITLFTRSSRLKRTRYEKKLLKKLNKLGNALKRKAELA
jgi:peptide deformylase